MRIIRDIFWILLIITVPVAIFDKFFRPYCMTVIERMCNKSISATNADAPIIRNARKRFVKPGNTMDRKNNRLCKS